MRIRMLAAALFMLLSAVLSACGGEATPTPGTPASQNQPTVAPSGGSSEITKVVVSSKNFAESQILGELYAIMLEVAQVPVQRQLSLGTTDVAQAALLKGGANGGIDLYPEYTSTGLINVLKQEPVNSPEDVYKKVKEGYKQFKLTWLDMSPMNDTQAFVTTKEVSDSLGVKSLADMCSKAGQLTLAAVAEFKDRPDAYPRLKQIYGDCTFKDIKSVEPNLRYKALLSKDVEIAQAFSTDGEISGNKLVLLEDPKNYGLAYNVGPVVRDDVLAKWPVISSQLNKLAPLITNEEISKLNWEVAGNGKDAHDVAKQWAYDKGLLPK